MKRVYLVLLMFFGFLALTAPANAADTSDPGANFALVLNSWPVILAGLVGVASTHLTELFAHYQAPQWVKSGINVFLATLGAVLVTIQTVPGYSWKDYAGEIIVAVGSSMVVHWTGVTSWLQTLTAQSGVGANARPIVVPPPSQKVLENPLPDTSVPKQPGK